MIFSDLGLSPFLFETKPKMMALVIQSQNAANLYGELSLQVFLSNIENVLLFLLIAIALFLIISTPLLLLYQTVDNWFKIKKYKTIIDDNICCENSKTHISYEKKVCSKYISNYSLFFANLLAFSIWLLLSLIYVNNEFTSMLTGIISFVEFPFTILESVDFKNVLASVTNYQSSWLFMSGILLSAILTYLISKYVFGKYIQKIVSKRVPHISMKASMGV